MVKRKPSDITVEAEPGVSAVILYEDAEARERAHEFCHRMEEQRGPQENLAVHWFSFEQLQRSDDAVRAFVKVVDADFVVFAAAADGELPRAIRFWLESSLRKRRAREGVMIGLIPRERGVGATSGSREIYLRQIAHRAGMDYLSKNPPAVAKGMPDSLDSFQERAGQMTSVLDTILHTRPAPPRF